MADLIDRIELRKDFCNMCEAMQPEMIDCEKKGCMSMQIIDEQTAVNRWIPCSERLPDYYDDILFCERDRTIHKGYMYWDGTFIEHYVKFEKKDIVAWMPLPELPKEDENGRQGGIINAHQSKQNPNN